MEIRSLDVQVAELRQRVKVLEDRWNYWTHPVWAAVVIFVIAFVAGVQVFS